MKLFGLLGANDTTTDDGSATFATDINSSLLVGDALHELTHAPGEPRLMPPTYVKRNKHDVADAEAICEAVGGSTTGDSNKLRGSIDTFRRLRVDFW